LKQVKFYKIVNIYLWFFLKSRAPPGTRVRVFGYSRDFRVHLVFLFLGV